VDILINLLILLVIALPFVIGGYFYWKFAGRMGYEAGKAWWNNNHATDETRYDDRR
jgi:hypothetical protein